MPTRAVSPESPVALNEHDVSCLVKDLLNFSSESTVSTALPTGSNASLSGPVDFSSPLDVRAFTFITSPSDHNRFVPISQKDVRLLSQMCIETIKEHAGIAGGTPRTYQPAI